jgi:hypothetical protein
VTIATAAPAAQTQPRQSSAGASAFRIDLDTTGGFVGRGRGGVTVTSDGAARASHVSGSTRDASTCRTRLSPDEQRTLQETVVAARQAGWPPTFTPKDDPGCCDRFKWTLRLEQHRDGSGAQTIVTTWYDGNEKLLPKELVAMKDIMVNALQRALAACG